MQEMIRFSFWISCLQVLYRYIGPRTLKAGFDGVVACILRSLTATKDCIGKTCSDINAWVKRTATDLKNSWAEYYARRKAGLSLEEHFGEQIF